MHKYSLALINPSCKDLLRVTVITFLTVRRPCDVYGCNYGDICNRTTLECNCADEDSQVGPRCQTAGGNGYEINRLL